MIIINDEFKEEIECCVLDQAYNLAVKSSQGRFSAPTALEAILRANQTQLIRNYTPPGTITGYIVDATATLDITPVDPAELVDGMRITVTTIYNTQLVILCSVVANLAGGTLADLKLVIINGINSGGSGYTASDGGGNLITIAFQSTIPAYPAGTTVTLAFGEYWYLETTNTVALPAGPAADTFTIYQTAQSYGDPAYTAYTTQAFSSVYVETENKLYVAVQAARRANQNFSANLDGTLDTVASIGPFTIGTGLDTDVYAAGQTGFITYENAGTVTSMRVSIIAYNDITGAITFAGAPLVAGVGVKQDLLTNWNNKIQNLPYGGLPTDFAAIPVLGNVQWYISMGNGYSSDSVGYGLILVYEWNQGAGTLDYLDYITTLGGTAVANLQYDEANGRIYYVTNTALGSGAVGYIDMGVDPLAIAAWTKITASGGYDLVIPPNFPTIVNFAGSYMNAYLMNNTLTTGANLTGAIMNPNPTGTTHQFDSADRLLYIRGTSIYYLEPFDDYLVNPGIANLMFTAQGGVTSIHTAFYHMPSQRYYILCTIGGVVCLQSYEILAASTQATIEASMVTYTPTVTLSSTVRFKYIQSLEYFILGGTTFTTFFDITAQAFINNSIPTSPILFEGYYHFPHQYDSANGHFWMIGAESTATPIAIHTFSLTSNVLEILGNFAGTITPIVYDSDNDCLTADQIQNAAQMLKAECGCDDCGDEDSTSGTIPSTPTYTLYYGANVAASLNAAGIEALGTMSGLTYAQDFVFPAIVGTYKYIAYPSALGTPSRIIDASTSFDVAMATPYNVTINSIQYTVYQTFNQLGGAITIRLIP